MQFTEKELNHIYLCVLADMVNGDRFGEEAKRYGYFEKD